MHTGTLFECDMCDYNTLEKHLLKRHLVVHQPDFKYFCPKRAAGFKHNNQLHHHRKK